MTAKALPSVLIDYIFNKPDKNEDELQLARKVKDLYSKFQCRTLVQKELKKIYTEWDIDRTNYYTCQQLEKAPDPRYKNNKRPIGSKDKQPRKRRTKKEIFKIEI